MSEVTTPVAPLQRLEMQMLVLRIQSDLEPLIAGRAWTDELAEGIRQYCTVVAGTIAGSSVALRLEDGPDTDDMLRLEVSEDCETLVVTIPGTAVQEAPGA
jgi:hypothetical protein